MTRILDVGCHKNFTRGTDFIDLYPERADVKKIDVDTDIFPYDNNTFDEVVAYYLFEHLTNHANFMQEAKRVLKPGGRLLICTDNAAFLGYTITHDHGKNFGTGHENDNHYALFTFNHMKNWALKFGFEIDNIYYDGGVISESYLKTIIKSFLYIILRKAMMRDIILIARKPYKKQNQ